MKVCSPGADFFFDPVAGLGAAGHDLYSGTIQHRITLHFWQYNSSARRPTVCNRRTMPIMPTRVFHAPHRLLWGILLSLTLLCPSTATAQETSAAQDDALETRLVNLIVKVGKLAAELAIMHRTTTLKFTVPC